jgi:Mannosyltransferase (PIG-V)
MVRVNEPLSSAEFLASSVPRWVRFVDAASLVMLGAAALLAVGDGVRLEIGAFRLSITSGVRVAAWAAVLIVVRHVVYRAPSLPTRVVERTRAWAGRDDAWFACRLSLTTRLPPVLIGLLAVATIGLGPEARPGAYADPWLNLPARWDATWYSDIAALGYRWDGDWTRQQNVVFFPAFPVAARLLARPLGMHVLYAGWLISLASFAAAMVLFVRLARTLVNERDAADAAWLLATYPFAVYFSAAYSESLFLLAMCGMFLSAHHARFRQAAAWGLVAGLTRPNGWLLAVPLALFIWERRPRPGSAREWVEAGGVVAAPIAGLLLFTFYLHLRFADGFAWLRGQAAWGRTFRGLHLVAAERIDYMREYGVSSYLMDFPTDALNTGAAVLALLVLIPVTKRLGLVYGALVTVLVLPPLLVGGTLSFGRLTSILFPVFIWLVTVVPVRHRAAVMVVFAALQGFAATLFFTWRPLF